MRTNVYVDGFNLYRGCRLRETPYRWLDLGKFCRAIVPRHLTIHRIRYFTARVHARPWDPSQPDRQNAYLRALLTVPNLTLHYGHFLVSTVRMPLATPPASGPRTVEVIKTEEKGSDVNLAALLLCDGYEGDYEAAVVISNDSDLTLPIEIVRTRLNREVGVAYPSKAVNPDIRPSVELRRVASFTREIPTRHAPEEPVPQQPHGRDWDDHQAGPVVTGAAGIAKP